MTDPPSVLRAHQSDQILELAWEGEPATRVSYRAIRAQCPCATCRDEWTGERLLDPATIRPDLKLEGMQLVGQYAVQFTWSDDHGSGLYTWDLLRKLATEHSGARWAGIDPPRAGPA